MLNYNPADATAFLKLLEGGKLLHLLVDNLLSNIGIIQKRITPILISFYKLIVLVNRRLCFT
jgi:hypothetical protein